MSLALMKQNFLKTKNFDLSHFRTDMRSFAVDGEIPRRLRESLTSEFEPEIEEDNESETWEPAQECPENCIHFSSLAKSQSEVTFTPRSLSVSTNSSSMSLIRKVSSFSIIESTKFERAAFLTITHLVAPMLDQSAIIHWTVKSVRGIRGFKIFLDGEIVTTVNSPERTSALIKHVDLSRLHRFSIEIVPAETKMGIELLRQLTRLEPALYFYDPRDL